MKTYQVRRASISLGLFNERELRALLQKGKLLPDDEIDQGAGQWGAVGTFVAALPSASPSGASAAQRQGSAPSVTPGRHFYLHAGGNRVGPLELSKLEGMAQAGLIDSSAMLEDVATPGQIVPVGNQLSLPSPPQAQMMAPTAQSVVGNSPSSSASSPGAATVTSGQTTASSVAKPKVSFLNLWLKATLWIYGIGAVFGFLAGNLSGFIGALLIGLLVAPIKGAFWGWIIWLIKK